MIRIPPETQIRSTIRLGSVYYFAEETFKSPEPHYFIVVNVDPLKDTIIFLVCSSSQVSKVHKRRRMCPSETLVEIAPSQYLDFNANSVVDCNYVMEKTIEQLVEKLSQGKLKLKAQMDASLVRRLRNGVFHSPLVERRIKRLLQKSTGKKK